MKIKKTSFFGFIFENFFSLDKYVPYFFGRKFKYQPENTLRNFRGPGKTGTPEKLI